MYFSGSQRKLMDTISAWSSQWFKIRKSIWLELISFPFINNLWVSLVLLTAVFPLLLAVEIIFPITTRNFLKT